jgi:hypothetical protein
MMKAALLSGPCPIGLPPLLLSLSNNLLRVSFNNDAELQNWLDDFFTAKLQIPSSVGSKTCPNIGK